MSPRITVVMPVYNGAAYLGEALRSILAQTERDFEFVIIDDGSKDGSESVIKEFTDPRIRFFRQANSGLAATLNRGIGLARGEYIARQDQDDISLPGRFEKQAGFLDAHPRCALVGTRAEIWEGERRTGRAHDHPAEDHLLKFDLLFDNPFVHSSVMLRKSALDKTGLYTTDPLRQPPEDYELWSRLARNFEVANIPERLHIYREFPGSMSREGDSPFLEKVIRISAENISWYSQTDARDRAVLDLAHLTHNVMSGVSATPDFAAMETALFKAAVKLTAEPAGAAVLKERAAEVMRGARRRCLRRGRAWDALRSLKRYLGLYGGKGKI